MSKLSVDSCIISHSIRNMDIYFPFPSEIYDGLSVSCDYGPWSRVKKEHWAIIGGENNG